MRAFSQASTRQLQTAIHGKLRVNVSVDFGVKWIGSVVAEFANTYPELLLEVDINSHVSTVSTSDYDVTVVMRSLMKANPHLVSRRIATIARGIYATPLTWPDAARPAQSKSWSDTTASPPPSKERTVSGA